MRTVSPPGPPPLLEHGRIARLDAEGITIRLGIDPQAPVFRGHYPDFPILPGVFLLDAAHHAVLRWAVERGLPAPRLAEVSSARFAGAVFPGDELSLDCVITATGDEDTAEYLTVAKLSTGRGRTASVRLRHRRG